MIDTNKVVIVYYTQSHRELDTIPHIIGKEVGSDIHDDINIHDGIEEYTVKGKGYIIETNYNNIEEVQDKIKRYIMPTWYSTVQNGVIVFQNN